MSVADFSLRTSLVNSITPPPPVDGSQSFTCLMTLQTHMRLHYMGVHIVLSKLNTELWIIQVCQAVKTALHTCFPCKISKNPFEQEREAPMPAKRLTVLKPFKVTGIDFARSLDVKRGIHLRKCCTELFTCMMV